MSHAATHWLAEVPPEDMTNGEFRVLFHLCDCHNASMGCFPKQAYLRTRTGLSNGGLNKALAGLEIKRLIRREKDRDERTNRQKPTHYILGFEIAHPQEPTPLSGDGAVSTSNAVPSPLSEGFRLHPGGVVYKDKPVNEPVKEPCVSPEAPHTQDFVFEVFLRKFETVFPRLGDGVETEKQLKEAIDDGTDPEVILGGARAYAAEQKGNRKQYIARSENWIRQKRWAHHRATTNTAVDPQKVLEARAETILAGKPYLCGSISAHAAGECITAGLVTLEQCHAVGIAI